MNLSFVEMQALLPELTTSLTGASFKGLTTLSPRKFLLEFAGHKLLLLCFQEPFLRFHLVLKKGRGHRTPFTDNLQESLEGQLCREIKLLHNDRILSIVFSSGLSLIGEFFAKKPNFYLLDSSGKILISLNPTPEPLYIPPTPHDNVSTLSQVTHQEIADRYETAEFEREKALHIKELRSSVKASTKALERLKSQFAKGNTWQEIQHEGILLQAHLYLWKRGLTEIQVQDWENEGVTRTLKLDPKLTAEQEIQKRFTIAKKFKKSLPHLEQLISQAENEHGTLLKKLDNALLSTSPEDLIPLPPKAAPKLVQKALPYLEFVTEAGFPIWVGKSAAKNEELTFKYAHGSDLWLHVSDVPGSHVILKLKKGQEPDRESLLDAMTLAIAYSKAKGQGHAEVIVAYQKNISRFGKGRTGKVQVSHHKKERIALDPTRLQRLKSKS